MREDRQNIYLCSTQQKAILDNDFNDRNNARNNAGNNARNRGPHGYADMNISSMDISMNITDMNTIFSSWIISMNISVLLKFHGYEYGYAPNIHEYSWI
jgi:hypothetical protein